MAHNGNDIDLRVHVLKTLLYYDIFNYPLKCKEVFKFLGTNSITEADVQHTLEALVKDVVVFRFNDLYSIQPNESNIHRRLTGNKEAEKCLGIAGQKAKLISKFPFVRAVLASGSLSKGYMDERSDIDYFIITAPNRLWIARTLLVMYKRLFLKGSHKHFCVNYFVDEDHLEIEEKNLFTATELATVLPLYGAEQYTKLIKTNNWLKGFFPNYTSRRVENVPVLTIRGFKKVFETLINACFATHIESFFRSLTMNRWKRLYEKEYSKADFDIAFKSKEYASKNHPRHFQRTIMDRYSEKVKLFDFSLVLKNKRNLSLDSGIGPHGQMHNV
ncbi:MAG TPA: hypothetical protein VK589_21910 [Chryseolinea sp.]|nr:hypothetical protein [Chryseolinea sp.]